VCRFCEGFRGRVRVRARVRVRVLVRFKVGFDFGFRFRVWVGLVLGGGDLGFFLRVRR
jgi:hypothetical protein